MSIVMDTQDYTEFWDWVRAVMDESGMSYNRIERAAGLSSSAVWKRANRNVEPTETTIDALALSLPVSKRDLMIRAGKLAPDADADTGPIADLIATARQLTPEQAENVLRYIAFQFPDLGA